VHADTAAKLAAESAPSSEHGAVIALQDRVIRQMAHRRQWLTAVAITVLAAGAGWGWTLRLTRSRA
jgi:hypothetical protein